MTSQVTVYSPMGIPLADLDVGAFRAWGINLATEASFKISTKDSKCREGFLQYGNILLIQHDTLPPWVGFFETPRQWDYGSVQCNAISAEVWFSWRLTHLYNLRDSLSDVFRYIIRDCNSWGGLMMGYGDIDDSIVWAWANLGGKASDQIDRMVEQWGVEWSITHRITTSGRLQFYANLYENLRGNDTHLVLNNANSKMISPLLTEDGAIFNDVFYMSEQGTGKRTIGRAQDETSIGTYGLRQLIEQGTGAYQPALEFMAWMKLQETKNPSIMTSASVLKIGDAWNHLQIGNTFYFDSEFSGFHGAPIGISAMFRIVGMEYTDGDDAVGLIAELAHYHLTSRERLALAKNFV
jgi:hypothetical protein